MFFLHGVQLKKAHSIYQPIEGKKIELSNSIQHIIDPAFLQSIQDFFSHSMNVASLTVDSSGPITRPSNFTELCSHYTRDCSTWTTRCDTCHKNWGDIAAQKGETIFYTCHAGLTSFAVPVFVEEHLVATILGGQVLTETPDEVLFRKIAKDLQVNEDYFIEQINKIKILPAEKLKAAAQFLYTMANSISSLVRANLKLSEFGAEYKVFKDLSIEGLFSGAYEKKRTDLTDRELEVLRLIVLGKTNTEIGKELFVSTHTVKKHVSSIIQKLSVDDRVQVAVKAVRERII